MQAQRLDANGSGSTALQAQQMAGERLVNHRRIGLFASCLLFACSVAPSRTPLGGNYALPESAPAGDRRAQVIASAQPDAAAPEPVTAAPVASATSVATDAAEVVPVAHASALRFEPLQVGTRIKGDVTLNAEAEMTGGPPAMRNSGKLALDSRLRVELKVLKASGQGPDEIELTLTTLSMHSEFGGQRADNDKQEPPETYDIILSGSSPSIRPRRGATVNPIERLKIAILVAPLVEFNAHWLGSAPFELKPGWVSQVPLPFAATLFATSGNETMSMGPLSTRFISRTKAGDDVPFEISLPATYGSKLGKIELALTGTATLNGKSGRPSAFELSGPLRAKGGPDGAQLNFAGTVRFAGTLGYQ